MRRVVGRALMESQAKEGRQDLQTRFDDPSVGMH